MPPFSLNLWACYFWGKRRHIFHNLIMTKQRRRNQLSFRSKSAKLYIASPGFFLSIPVFRNQTCAGALPVPIWSVLIAPFIYLFSGTFHSSFVPTCLAYKYQIRTLTSESALALAKSPGTALAQTTIRKKLLEAKAGASPKESMCSCSWLCCVLIPAPPMKQVNKNTHSNSKYPFQREHPF
jgi:hypothetical protein